MTDDLYYVPGDFYRLDDRSGFKVRARKQRKEWTELIVDKKLWEARHPQDFVKGVFDDQRVPYPRPRPTTDPTVGFIQTTLSANAAAGANSIMLTLTTGFNIGDVIEIMLDTKEFYRTTILGFAAKVLAPLDNYLYFQNIALYQMPTFVTVPSNTINISGKLPYSAAAGNIVEDWTNVTTVAPSRAELSTDLNG